MKSKYLKIFISLILVVTLCLAFTVVQSYAIPLPIVVGGAGLAIGGLAWAISSAMGVDFALSNFTSQNIGQSFDPWYTIQTALNTSDFTLIKGLRTGFDALKLSVSAYNAIKQGAINIISDNNIPDNSTGIISDYSYNGINFPTQITSNTYLSTPLGIIQAGMSYSIGNFNITYNSTSGSGGIYCDIYANGSSGHGTFPSSQVGNPFYLRYSTSGAMDFGYYTSSYNKVGPSGGISLNTDSYPWTSEIVDTSFGQTALDNVTVIFPETALPSTASLDDILVAINALALQNDQSVSVEVDVAPGPTPVPIPTDALGDIPFNQFIDIYGGSVFEEIDNQTQVIDTLGQSVGQYFQDQTDTIDTYGQSVVEGIENQTDVIDTAGQCVVTAVENQTDVIDTVGQDVVEAIESVDTNIQTGTGILSGIRTLVDSAVNTLEDIGEMVGELVEDIVLGTETLISGILNQIPSLFNVILSPIKTAASIWHYVVEWIQSITGPFQFIWSMANGTSYYIVLPVYASLASAVVLAFYKRFGK